MSNENNLTAGLLLNTLAARYPLNKSKGYTAKNNRHNRRDIQLKKRRTDKQNRKNNR